MNIFLKHDDYEYYKELLLNQCVIHELKIISYCLMTNHIHLIVVPKTEESLSRAIGETHRLYTRKINFEHKVKGHLFQERFYSTPLDDQHFLYALRYVEQNPVKANMVQYPWDYQYSSAKYRVTLIEEKTRTGKPCGDEAFYEKIKLSTGIDYNKKKSGPKVKNDS